ncbi:formate dehydrogenase subunit delta [Amphibiibacter pelophylacis]|uniref:Formate dehydrogenase subunit delta n=1 Tax=Amphibiibacter pelophylacis TaxID=1799477 RepID=A0ACC6P0H3_9BURK
MTPLDPGKLATMANRIAEFFAAMPDHAEAVDGVASHIRRFWAPQMRQDFVSQFDAGALPTLHPLVQEVLERHRGALAG